ncbi:MAG TPA: CoA-binding protein [Thermoanaerobaculia bacterium]|nr:CoA-binding protein [Thermoanaerobaculia bacterium]
MKTIAVLGASKDRSKYGNKCVRAYKEAGYKVFPVNLGSSEPIEGFETYRKLTDIPVELDRISVYLPPPVTLELLPEIAAKGAGEVWFNPGSADQQVLEEARRRGLKAVPGCSIIDVGMSPSQFPG